MDKRRHQRIEVENLVANLSNGVDSYSGTVSDVSPVGLLVTDISQELNKQGEKLSIIISVKDKDFKMAVVPKWDSGNKSKNKMGLAILDAPLDWAGFMMKLGMHFTQIAKIYSNASSKKAFRVRHQLPSIMNYEQTDEDIWAATTHFPDYLNFSIPSIAINTRHSARSAIDCLKATSKHEVYIFAAATVIVDK